MNYQVSDGFQQQSAPQQTGGFQQQGGHQQQGGFQQQPGNRPIDKGRVAFVAEKYPSNERDPKTGQQIMKNRYATIGRATKWNRSGVENVEFEIDSIPVGHQGPIKCFVFWDSQQN